MPGPGHYNILSENKQSKKKSNIFQFFGSSSDRFPPLRKNIEDKNICPGMYSQDFQDKIKKENRKEVPFGASENRFFGLKSLSVEFSPGNFHLKALAEKYKTKQKNFKGNFGSSEKRFLAREEEKNRIENVGPGSYDTEKVRNIGHKFNSSTLK